MQAAQRAHAHLSGNLAERLRTIRGWGRHDFDSLSSGKSADAFASSASTISVRLTTVKASRVQPAWSVSAGSTGSSMFETYAWVERLLRLHREFRQDAFVFWPVGDAPLRQLQAFAEEIVPAVREQVQGAAAS
jgi:hypothetical protein